MTNTVLHAPELAPRFNGTIASLFMAAIVILTGFVSVAVFAG